MSTNSTLKAAIDTAITNKNTQGSIAPSDVGTQMKAVVDYANSLGSTVFRAILDQSATNDPVMTILENNTGLTWIATRSAVGTYNITPNTPPNADKCLCLLGTTLRSPVGAIIINGGYYGADNIAITSYNSLTAALSDGLLNNLGVELRIYP